jgi:hypothetical protein
LFRLWQNIYIESSVKTFDKRMPFSVVAYPIKKLRFLVIVIVSIITVCFCSCSNQPDGSKLSEKKVAFKRFLSKFDILRLPMNIKPGRMPVDHYRKLDSTDNSFTGYKDKTETLYAFGVLSDTASCFKVIWLEPADDYYPVLATFTKSGRKIKQENIGVGGCGVDCGFQCSETIDINKDMSIYSADSVTYNDCDTNGNPNGTVEKYVRYKTGRIQKSGKIKMSKILKKSF